MINIETNIKYITFPTAETYWRTEILPKETSSAPVHILVPKASQRKKGPEYICHILSENLPDNSFIEVAPDIYVICPELCFLLAANYYPIHKLVLLGNDLCATYYSDNRSQYGQQHRPPVTCKKAVIDYLNKCFNIKGLKKALVGIKYVLDNSNSPMESIIAVLMTLPISYGGYALLAPDLNQEIVLSPSGAMYLGRKTCRGDAVWEDERLVLEYDSLSAHLSLEQFHYDKKRASAIAMSGYRIISVTSDQLKNFRAVENLFETLRHELGMRKYQTRFDKYLDKRYQIIHELIMDN